LQGVYIGYVKKRGQLGLGLGLGQTLSANFCTDSSKLMSPAYKGPRLALHTLNEVICMPSIFAVM